MKRILILTMLALTAGVVSAPAYDLPEDIDLIEVSFNHETGHANDAITIKYDEDSYVVPPEWEPGDTEKFAYIRSTTPTIEAKIQRNDAGILKAYITAEHYQGTSFGDFDEAEFVFGGQSTADTVLTHESGTSIVSNAVVRDNISLKWYVTKITDAGGDTLFVNPVHFATSYNTYYVVLDEPVTPFSEPFVCALESACYWANGATSAGTVVSSITSGAYDNSIVDYKHDVQHYRHPNFYLTDMYVNGEADCSSIAAFVQTLSKALGVSGVTLTYIGGSFVYRSIDPIGAPADTLGSYAYHFVAEYNDGIYDACLQFYPSGYQPLGMTMQAYHDSLYVSGNWNVYPDVATPEYIK